MKPSRDQYHRELDRLKREREERNYYHGENPNRIKPTPQTLNKRKKDVIIELEDRGSLDKEQVAAALEIRGVFQKLQSGMFAGASYDFSGSGGSRGTARQPLDRLSDEESHQWGNRYVPWMNEIQVIAVRPGLRLSEMVMDIIIDNMGCQQSADLHGMARDTVKARLGEALNIYVELVRKSPYRWRRGGI